tara:strand:- start:336 stop:1133 length:798 start_codon:yes stop_codon:yes gene_type:complete
MYQMVDRRKVVVWAEDEDRSGSATGLAAIADLNQGTITNGDNLRFPKGFNYVYMGYFWTEFAAYAPERATISQAKIANNPVIFNKGIALNYLSPNQVYDFRRNPFQLNTGEDTTVQSVESDEAGVAHKNGLVLFLCDSPKGIRGGRPPRPITHIHTCTVAQATALTWTNCALTEINALPSGEYVCWGARIHSATPIAARLNFDNIDDRPPIIPVSREEDPTHPYSEYWGTSKYRFTIPDGLPSVDVLASATETPSDIELYLTKIK